MSRFNKERKTKKARMQNVKENKERTVDETKDCMNVCDSETQPKGYG
jgi:hypothetical protein